MTRIRWALVAIALGVAALWLGRTLGDQAGQQALARLQTLWPAIMTMDKSDRAALAIAALYCELERLPEPVSSAEIVACLRRGASDTRAKERFPDLPRRIGALIDEVRRQPISPTTTHKLKGHPDGLSRST